MPVDNSKVEFFARIIEKETGIVYSSSVYFQLEWRLKEIAKAVGCGSLEELWERSRLVVLPAVKRLLIEFATNNETSFFRDPPVFERGIKAMLLDILCGDPPKKLLRIWSAGCSTGQEPYSLAILMEKLGLERTIPPYEILATDLSAQALWQAKKAQYTEQEIKRGVPAEILHRYFLRVDGVGPTAKRQDTRSAIWEIKPDIRNKVKFEKLNLMTKHHKLALGAFDLILCRNVLIYQSSDNKGKIVSSLSSYLLPRGYLMLGATETLIGVSNELHRTTHCGVTCYQKKELAKAA